MLCGALGELWWSSGSLWQRSGELWAALGELEGDKVPHFYIYKLPINRPMAALLVEVVVVVVVVEVLVVVVVVVVGVGVGVVGFLVVARLRRAIARSNRKYGVLEVDRAAMRL